jgi:hypothetical protein
MIHPKVKASVSASAVLGAAVVILRQFGVDVPADAVAVVGPFIVFVAGYVAPGAVAA